MKRLSLFFFFYLFSSFVGLPPLGYATTLNQRKADRSSGFTGVIRVKKNHLTGGIYSFKIFQMERIENLMVSISYTVL
jgi:hypothetical protein